MEKGSQKVVFLRARDGPGGGNVFTLIFSQTATAVFPGETETKTLSNNPLAVFDIVLIKRFPIRHKNHTLEFPPQILF